MNDVLMHVGTPHEGMTPHSGRYPFGSGEHGHQRDTSFLWRVEQYKRAGITDEKDLVKALGLRSTTEYRDLLTNARAADRAAKVARASYLHFEKGMGASEIAEAMGMSKSQESTVRSWLNPEIKARAEIGANTAKMLKENVDKKKYIDVGVGVENWLGISQTKLRAAVNQLEQEGYHVETLYVEQLGTGNQTTLKVLVGPETTWADVSKNRDKISLCTNYTENGGRSYLNLEKPTSVSSKRILVNYESPKDGVIELRRGVPDISLGKANYAQVRIAVDGTHYLKGMAMYSDKIPDGYDIIFNTNKSSNVPMINKDPKGKEVLKRLKEDSDNPFGATIKNEDKLQLGQRHYTDENGKERLSPINIVNEQGDWAKWSKSLSSQFLSKQSAVMAKNQLDLAYANQNDEFSTIKNLTNPVIKQKLLDQFADDCDSKAVHLKAAGLPRQASHVILPFPSMKPTEVYAPNYRDGERVVLIRYPHGGKFEIPELTVNNNNKEAKKTIGKSPDAIGINQEVAKRLSGADFDGDTVLVIPVNRRVKVDTINTDKTKYYKTLQDFDPQLAYPGYDGMRTMTKKERGIEMGRVTNLISDMQLKNASEEEIVRAVKHSMVVIDAEKHKLNWKQSEKDFRIRELMKEYQGKAGGGASTLISRASKEEKVPARKEKRPSQMTPEELKRYYEGEKIWEYTGKTHIDKKTGEVKGNLIKSTKAYEIDDAYKLTSGGSKQNPGTVIESVYASYSNKMKALANAARKESRGIQMPSQNSSAKKAYAAEVASLYAKWNQGMKNKPLERQAQLIANKTVAAKRASNPNMDADEVKRLRAQALDAARHRVGKPPYVLKITDREWEAIQAGAVSSTKLKQIIDFADADAVKKQAMPKTKRGMTQSQIARARALQRSGYTQAQIADELGFSVSTIREALL